ncbi:replication initiation protein [Helicobacter pylori]|uniref:replication initiation protein n=1 Tax=Helicobacter pylori TaxID=210 RepID=UPI000D34C97C|nr:replication initiation protein [Helicobacter pylori]PUD25241.1 initiator RepB protein [Helicobacter pylori]
MPKVNNEPKPKKPKKFKRPRVKKSQKYLVTQDNRFIYAKYGDTTANELKFFYYVISKLNSISDKDFELHEVPVSEILGEVLSHESEDNYTYIKNLCRSLSKRILEDESIVFDPVTNKKEEMFEVMAIFKRIQYLKRKAVICYQLNDCLKPYLLGLRKNFTQIPLQHILPINSGYAIRIYQILLSELKQNKNESTKGLLYLQNVLCVPKSMYKWDNFKRNVLEPSIKEINATTDIVASYHPLKERQKITEIVFEICYKDLQRRKDQAKDKEAQRIQVEVIKPLTELKNKTLAYPTDPLDENANIALVYRGMHEVKEMKGKLQVVLTLEEANNPRKKQQLIIANANQIEKLKAMHERYEQKFFTQNASKVLKNKDGSGLAYAQQIKENLKKGKEEAKTIENKPTLIENKATQEAINQEAPTHRHKIFDKAFREANKQEIESMTKDLGGLFSNNTKKDPSNQ